MKILVLNYEYPPLGAGAGIITKNISEGLARLGHSVTVITTWYKTEKEKDTNGNLTVIRLKSKRKKIYGSTIGEMLSWIRASKQFLTTYMAADKFDLCFANFAIPGGIVALYLKKQFALKFTVISHGHDIPWMFPKQMIFYHALTYFRIKKICRESEFNFVQTFAMKNNIDRFLGKRYDEKNIIISNGMDVSAFIPDNSKKSPLFKITFIGRLVEQKDPFTFLKAVKLYSKENKNMIVHIIGDGKLRSKMEKFTEANALTDIVKFKGWLPKDKMIYEYQSAHINVAPYIFEGMSISILEAISTGCFLITTPLAGIMELVNEGNAAIVNFKSPEEIARQMENYYKKRFLNGHKIEDSAITELKIKYSWDTIVKKYEYYFEKCISQ